MTNDTTTKVIAADATAAVAAPKPRTTKRAARAAAGDATVADAWAGYLRALGEAGKSAGTLTSYGLELDVASRELGLKTRLAEVTPERVLLLFACDRVTRTRSGRPKSRLSTDKTKRVVRQALVWAEAAGLVAKAPLPEAEASH